MPAINAFPEQWLQYHLKCQNIQPSPLYCYLHYRPVEFIAVNFIVVVITLPLLLTFQERWEHGQLHIHAPHHDHKNPNHSSWWLVVALRRKNNLNVVKHTDKTRSMPLYVDVTKCPPNANHSQFFGWGENVLTFCDAYTKETKSHYAARMEHIWTKLLVLCYIAIKHWKKC